MKRDNNIINIKLKTFFNHNNIYLVGFLSIRDKLERINRDNLKLRINENIYDICFPIKRIKNIRGIAILSNFYIIKIPINTLLTEKIHNKPFFIYQNGEEENKWSLRYSLFCKKVKYKKSKIKILKSINTSIYARQTSKNRLVITVREINRTDYLKEQLKINLACFISKFIRKRKIIMYEKHSERYEESASVLYEKLIDQGYKNIYYIVNRNCKQIENVNNIYRKNFIYKYTFKHYLSFFTAKTLIGSETPGHAMELRIANKHVAYRIYKGNFQYVFLQHGVMYMVSLDSKGRSAFRRDGVMPINSKIVVSSLEEANHFITLACFRKEDLYITGLPKYDRNKWNKGADKIVVMLTWRPWEYNLIRNDISNSPYFSLIKKIINNIPENLRRKVILMPHPLILESLKKSELAKYILNDFMYDDVLKDTKVLITDYSSVAYDAFYRGSNIIFYWEEKDYCMEQYKGHLMLNDENAFGKICYTIENLAKVIKQSYEEEQAEEYIKRYKKIVEFSDNKNTDRLINLLKKDKII